MSAVYLGLGSNLGDRKMYLTSAIKKLNQSNVNVLEISAFIETDPVGGPPQDKYLNAVIKAKTTLDPHQLLKTTLLIEKGLGRIRTMINGPRTIDIDILLFDTLKIQTPELTIPHPRMLERDFVMNPLKEIAPELVKELKHAHRH